jgi:glyoxylase-like metal-dependent hydrolase (beta-lactamase superfamily II)
LTAASVRAAGEGSIRLHHLNCGSLDAPLGVALFGNGGLLRRARAVMHCVLAETDDGLLLIDTGLGTRDVESPAPFLRLMLALGGAHRSLDETAASQVQSLGYGRDAVRHIILTHFHFDHAGGLPDFPQAQVHIYRGEHEAVTRPRGLAERLPYRVEHWAHGPRWVVHDTTEDKWFGFESTAPVLVGSAEFRLVPLTGHTRGHCAVALRTDWGWLLHCGDAYTFHGEVDPENPRRAPYQRLVRPLFNVSSCFRRIGDHSSRLRALARAHGDQVRLTCSHDPVELARFAGEAG